MAEKLDPEVKCIGEKEQVEASGPRARQSPKFARNLSELRAAHLRAAVCGNTPDQLSVVVSPNFHVSKTPLKDLVRTSLQKLNVDCTFHGGYLILRTIEPVYGKEAITTLVEDHEGNFAIFKLFNYTIHPSEILQQIIPLGTVFALKEPFCSESLEGDCILNCESLSDMIVIYEGHELSKLTDGITWETHVIDPVKKYPVPTTAYAWKDTGDDFHMLGKLQLALRCFYMAQKNINDVANKETFQNLLNLKLALVYGNRGFFETSLKFVEKVLRVNPGDSIAVSSAGSSCYNLGRYEDALKYFRSNHTYYSPSVIVNSLARKCTFRIDEKQRSLLKTYNFALAPFTNPYKLIEYADYTGPVTITEIEGKGRGVVATRDIAAGTLLIVSKALAFSFKLVKSSTPRQNKDIECWQDLLIQLAQKIACNPNTFGPLIYSLCDGFSPGGVDPPRVFCDPEEGEEPIVDMMKLKGIIDSNMMGNGTSVCKSGYGIFYWPSLFNHCCLPNTSVIKYTDLMVIRATKSIGEGEEAFIPCMSSDKLLHLREKLCSTRGVRCTCRYCQMDEELPESTSTQRRQFANTYERIFTMVTERQLDKVQQITMKIRRLIDNLQEHYANYEPFIRNTVLATVYTLFSKVMEMTGVENARTTRNVQQFEMQNELSERNVQQFEIQNELSERNVHQFQRRNELSERTVYRLERQIECFKMILKFSGFNPPDMLRSIEEGSELIPPSSHLNKNVLDAVVGMCWNYNNLRDTNFKKKWIKILIALELIYSGGDIRVIKLNYPIIRVLLNDEIL